VAERGASNQLSYDVQIEAPSSSTEWFRFQFSADPFLQVYGVEQQFESASASLHTEVRMVNDRGATVFLWTPGVTAGEIGVASEIVPFTFSLNQTMMSNTDQIVNPFIAENFQVTSVGLPGGHYTLTFVTSSAANASHSSVVPEPETYAMLLAGLGLLGWRLRRV
jgi:hypothetical protein